MSRLKYFLWKIWKKTFIIAVIELMIALVPSAVSANVYLCGYFTGSALNTNYLIFDATPFYIPAGQIPSGDFLAGVLSVAGVKKGILLTGLSGWIYQVGSGRDGNGDLFWSSQVWDMGNNYAIDQETMSTDTAAWAGIYMRIGKMTTDSYASICWGYKNDLDHLSFYQPLFMYHPPKEVAFRIGTSTHNGITFKHCQFGVESINRITGYSWEFAELRIGYYDGSNWLYRPANVAQRDSSWITWRGDYGARIADFNYDGVNRASSANDAVWWLYTGTTIADGSSLWTGSGSVDKTPSEPFVLY